MNNSISDVVSEPEFYTAARLDEIRELEEIMPDKVVNPESYHKLIDLLDEKGIVEKKGR